MDWMDWDGSTLTVDVVRELRGKFEEGSISLEELRQAISELEGLEG